MSDGRYTGPLEKVDDYCWRIPASYKPEMRVDALIFASEQMIEAIKADQAPEQVANVAALPGIVNASLAMPDIHWGYGFCIGGVCATDPQQGGVVSPGGVGYDINCGVRLVRTNLQHEDIKGDLNRLMDAITEAVPAGVGRTGPFPFAKSRLRILMREGPAALQSMGVATDRDIAHTEAQGRIDGADPEAVSDRALERGTDQCGTLGGGNHFLEVQAVAEVFDQKAADAMGLQEGAVCLTIHSGSRGLGYQVCDDTLREFRKTPEKYGIDLPDRQLACAPIDSPEGQRYLGAMRAAANFAFCNRQLLMAETRRAFAKTFGTDWESLGMELVYDVAHNIAKHETHTVDGEQRDLWVHRKGATRAFPPGHPELPDGYHAIGQPVLIPGDMGRASYVLVGQPGSMERTFGTTCHGAGRAMSRTRAKRTAADRAIDRELAAQGVVARARSRKGLAEEIPEAYKDARQVVDTVEGAGISSKVARLRPIGVLKG